MADRVFMLLVAMSFGATISAEQPSRPLKPPDLSKIERRVRKEPAYKAERPLYALYVFGPEAKTHVWAVLDKSDRRAASYDVLYFDRDADGDLTGTDERIVGKADGDAVTFTIGRFTDPRTRQEHTDVSLLRVGGKSPYTMLLMKWCGKVAVRGGCSEAEGPQLAFAPSPAKAPIVWPGAESPFGFQPWSLEPFRIGRANDFRVFMGHAGIGPKSFSAVHNTLLPKKVPILATLSYKDRAGKQRQARIELTELSCGVLRCGMVRVPPDAVPGKASVRVELPKDAEWASVPTEVPVELVADRSD